MMGMDIEISFLQALEGFLFQREAAKNIIHDQKFFVGYSNEGHGAFEKLLKVSCSGPSCFKYCMWFKCFFGYSYVGHGP